MGRGDRRTRLLRSGFATGMILLAQGMPLARAAPGEDTSDWEEVTREEDVTVTQREVRGRSFPIFRGVTVIEASPYDVLAVLRDVNRYTEWMHQCVDSRLLEPPGDDGLLVYNRTKAGWLVSDRDSVVRSHLEIRANGREMLLHFRAVDYPQFELVDGVVRMLTLEGYYKLEQVGAQRTRVEYLVSADPGGRLPKWFAKRATRDLPLRTLVNLREQVSRTRGAYEDFLREWDPRHQLPFSSSSR